MSGEHKEASHAAGGHAHDTAPQLRKVDLDHVKADLARVKAKYAQNAENIKKNVGEHAHFGEHAGGSRNTKPSDADRQA